MKRIRIFVSITLLLVTLTGCGTQKAEDNDSPNNNTSTEATTDKVDSNMNTTNDDVKNTESNTKKNNTSTNSNKTEKSTNTNSNNITKKSSKDQKSFYGNWEIKKIVGYAKVTSSEGKELTGVKINLSKDLATVANESYDNPKYEIKNKTKGEIISYLKTNPSDIGLNASSITEVDVSDKTAQIRMILLIKDNNTLLYTSTDGAYYEATRVS